MPTPNNGPYAVSSPQHGHIIAEKNQYVARLESVGTHYDILLGNRGTFIGTAKHPQDAIERIRRFYDELDAHAASNARRRAKLTQEDEALHARHAAGERVSIETIDNVRVQLADIERSDAYIDECNSYRPASLRSS